MAMIKYDGWAWRIIPETVSEHEHFRGIMTDLYKKYAVCADMNGQVDPKLKDPDWVLKEENKIIMLLPLVS